jgi:UDPglucose 6-dehydrogenase
MANAREMLDGIDYAEDAYACAKGADALVIVTEWDAFRALDFERIKTAMSSLVVVDLRNIYDPEDMRRRGFTYVSVGRPPERSASASVEKLDWLENCRGE